MNHFMFSYRSCLCLLINLNRRFTCLLFRIFKCVEQQYGVILIGKTLFDLIPQFYTRDVRTKCQELECWNNGYKLIFIRKFSA